MHTRRVCWLTLTVVLVGSVDPPLAAQADRSAAAVVDLPFAAVDQSLWRGPDSFSIPAYHALGERSFNGVFVRRQNDPMANTWAPGLELVARPRDDGKVDVIVRVSLTVPTGGTDRAVNLAIRLIDGAQVVKQARVNVNVKESKEQSVEKMFVLTPDFLNNRPPPILRLVIESVPTVVDLPFAATDQSLWKGDEWFSIPGYDSLGERSFNGVFIRRQDNPIAKTWAPGLELMVKPRDDGKVNVVVRTTLRVPGGQEDKEIDISIQLIDSGRIAKKAWQKIFVGENKERAVEKAFVVTPAFLNARPAPTLRVIVRATTDTRSTHVLRTALIILPGLFVLGYFMRF